MTELLTKCKLSLQKESESPCHRSELASPPLRELVDERVKEEDKEESVEEKNVEDEKRRETEPFKMPLPSPATPTPTPTLPTSECHCLSRSLSPRLLLAGCFDL